MKYIMGIFCLMIMATTDAQNVYSLQDPLSSKFFTIEKYGATEGSPFLFKSWMQGTVTTPKGTFENLQLKVNVYDNMLVFNKDDQAFEMQEEVTGFTLKPEDGKNNSVMTFRKGVTGADIKSNQFVQVLTTGKATVYKLPTKQVSEVSRINAGVIKTFTDNNKYYIEIDKRVQFIKINKDDIVNALEDKADQLQTYMNTKKINPKKESDLIEIVNYYNTL